MNIGEDKSVEKGSRGKVSKNRGFKVSGFQSFRVSRFQVSGFYEAGRDRPVCPKTFSRFPFWAEKPVNVPSPGV
jgi:nucleoside diphosphate kinase